MGRDWRRVPWHLRYQMGARLASRFRQSAIQATHLHTDVRFGPHCRLGPGFSLDIPGSGSLHVGTGVDFRRGFVCEIGADGLVQIGDYSHFTSNTLIQVSTGLKIGERCAFGQSTMIVDGNHRFRDHTQHSLDQGYDFRPIVIEDGAIVLSKCTVLADIGERAVIAANSVVTRPIPAYCLAGGVPARVIEYFGPLERRPDGLGDLQAGRG